MVTRLRALQTGLCWTARIVGALLVGLVLLFALGEGVRVHDLDASTGAMMATFIAALAGMFILWRWELVGGIMVLLGMGGFYAMEYLSSGDLPGGWVFPLCFAPGVLALASWAFHRMCHRRSSMPDSSC